MANALWKKEVVIRQNSTIGIVAAQNWTKNWLASFQDDPDNIDGNGDYIDHFFGDLFDARTGNLYRIFSDAAGAKYSMPNVIFDVLITSKFVPWTSVSDDPNFANDPNKIATRGSILSHVNNKISTFLATIRNIFIAQDSISDDPDLATDDDFLITRGGLSDVLDSFVSNAKVINDAGVISDDKITIAHVPSGGIIGGKCMIKETATNIYDEVDCIVSGTTVTIATDNPGQYDGEIAMVSYLINQ